MSLNIIVRSFVLLLTVKLLAFPVSALASPLTLPANDTDPVSSFIPKNRIAQYPSVDRMRLDVRLTKWTEINFAQKGYRPNTLHIKNWSVVSPKRMVYEVIFLSGKDANNRYRYRYEVFDAETGTALGISKVHYAQTCQDLPFFDLERKRLMCKL